MVVENARTCISELIYLHLMASWHTWLFEVILHVQREVALKNIYIERFAAPCTTLYLFFVHLVGVLRVFFAQVLSRTHPSRRSASQSGFRILLLWVSQSIICSVLAVRPTFGLVISKRTSSSRSTFRSAPGFVLCETRGWTSTCKHSSPISS